MAASDTIFALASAQGRAGVSVIRVSGSKAHDCAVALTGKPLTARQAVLRSIKDPKDGELIDKGLLIFFDGNASFTGEPVIEFQIHGSIAVVDRLLGVLGHMDQMRLAEPGEFTKRALLNGKMDLTEVEGLGDLIAAETEEQRRQANKLMAGALSEKIGIWKNKILKINALLEASIDFSDEELPDDLLAGLETDLTGLIEEFQAEIAGSKGKEIVRQGFVVAIVGKPNAGKSTLLNTLVGRDVAIASEIAGTTRDVIEVRLDLDGFAVVMLDTAGLHTTDEKIEAIGIERARLRASDADLRIVLTRATDDVDDLDLQFSDDDIIVHAMADLDQRPGVLNISAKTGLGLDEIEKEIGAILRRRVDSSSTLVHQRHRDAMRLAIGHLQNARQLIASEGYDIELVSEAVRSANAALDHMLGRFDVESVLGEIFSSFCIGK